MKRNKKSILMLLFFMIMISQVAYGQEELENKPGKPKVEVEFIETEIDIEQGEEVGAVPLLREFMPGLEGEEDQLSQTGEGGIESIKLRNNQIILTNRALKKMIEDNEQLDQQSRDLDKQLRNIRGQRRIETNRMKSAIKERDEFKERMEEVVARKDQIEERVREIEKMQKRSTEAFRQKVAKLEKDLEEAKAAKVQLVQEESPQIDYKKDAIISSQEAVLASQELSMDVLNMVEDLNMQAEKIKRDKAKVHYNMGNIFFKQGKYRRCISEYKKSLKLSPDDANSHFNLAFVSGNYMNDYKTALEHYKEYLIINPNADDYHLVREKILEAEIYLKAKLDTSLEKDLTNERNRFIWGNN